MNEPLLFPIVSHIDKRGQLLKPYARESAANELPLFSIREVFLSVNHRDVLRGFHFQRPPHDHAKVVFVVQGQILDVLVDLRANGPRYGKVCSYTLGPTNPYALYVPRGFGHAFLAQSENAIVGYLQDTERVESAEDGLAWDSVDFRWPLDRPILSSRDQKLPRLTDLNSPWK